MPQGYLPIWVTLLVFLVSLAIGWGIGFADSNRNSGKKIQAAENKAQIALQEAQNKIADAEARIAAAAEIQAHDDPGLLRVKNENGRMTLEMDGQMINTPNLSVDDKKRLIAILTSMRPWLEGGQAVSASAPAARPAPTPQAATPPAAAVQPPPKPAPVTPTPAQPEPKPAAPAAAPADLGIVGQIDAILQERIANTLLGKRAIRLQQSPEGGVQVWIGLQKFSSIEDVTDPEVKAAIRAAVAEWEKKYTPGI